MNAKAFAAFMSAMFGVLLFGSLVAGLSSCKRVPSTPVRTNVDQAAKACEAQGSTLKSFKGSNNEYGSFDFECAPK